MALTSQCEPGQGEDEDENEERVDYKVIQYFAEKIQYIPTIDGANDVESRPQIIIPRRGEKDFEPLQETVNLQEMLLEKSRQAMFNALVGVRGGHNNSISHAVITPTKPFPQVLVIHGHLFDQMGITVRPYLSPKSKGKGKATLELLPEEALYLLERGSLQIWIGKDAKTEKEMNAGVGEWCEEEYGVKGAVEMSVMEGYGVFIGQEGLTWERYQAYAYLKRLGYNIQRSRQFIPEHFLVAPVKLHEQDSRLPVFHTWWLEIPTWIATLSNFLIRGIKQAIGSVTRFRLGLRLSRDPFCGTLLEGCCVSTYSSILTHLRIIPAGHRQYLPSRTSPTATTDVYAPLVRNPYIPFWHIWKPMTSWSKRNWDRGSEQGMKAQRPDYFAAVVQARTTPLPNIHQLDEVYAMLPDEPTGPIKRQGPQYQRQPKLQSPKDQKQYEQPISCFQYILEQVGWTRKVAKPRAPNINIGALRNGSRGFIVGVNDSGNNAWIRFGRTGFEEMPAM
ncbi:uncharacterized protein L203_104486 [Cryptococcus depauperatus CBS 7841]|uniref:Uncharacterized protein n=1 Tax=Cryptococcus depauperatus CBS 7841 TaxID=1295531 RepID=A0A1E3II95_9TREE|nr:tRNA-splicing endonuclease subunit Sen54 [Cryptococcus depauperatus CBS 7841]